MQSANFLWWIPGLPLLGSIVAGILHFVELRARKRSPGDRTYGATAAWCAVAAVGAAFVLGLIGFGALLEVGETGTLTSASWRWIDTGGFDVNVGMVLDRLSSVMVLVVTGVGFLIHVYAVGYMKGDPGYAKFFAYLNLFVAMMLLLVLSDSLPGLFVGWEGVGLCSYLLIGFWYEKGFPAEAAQKAFVVNRIGDACFLLGMFVLAGLFGSLDIATIDAGVRGVLADPERQGQLALAALLLFGGACGKSAQIPLFVWLPDAMAGPTPVSALIHAATMVTAGVYMVVRMNPLFAACPNVLYFIGTIGALTALVAGSTALVQRDLKKVLAYSTISQLGFMFLALGCGAWATAIFHLVTHAFFKALLFLGAGSVIHGMHEEQDMHRMGGLRKHMPRTFITFVAGAAALSGLPLLSGFFSKDEILAHAFADGGPYLLLWGVGIATAAMTAYYSWRMVALTFFGQERFDVATVEPHESPAVMTVPLMVLAVLAVVGGALGLPAVFHVQNLLGDWLAPVLAEGNELLFGAAPPHMSPATEWVLLGLGAALALAFAHKGFHDYRDGTAADARFASERPAAARFLGGAWGVDKAYATWIVQPVKLLAFLIAVVIDQFAIDGLVNGAGAGARRLGMRVRRLADGSIATYGLWMGSVTALLAFLWMWMGVR
ncbi:MAG: NADH-quinone oxidoreductase subunit L [Planctomycetota bacterium]|nr:MAG: NADH-quinone oxidoreductase subunit L [Planctomycetota bacterium]